MSEPTEKMGKLNVSENTAVVFFTSFIIISINLNTGSLLLNLTPLNYSLQMSISVKYLLWLVITLDKLFLFYGLIYKPVSVCSHVCLYFNHI